MVGVSIGATVAFVSILVRSEVANIARWYKWFLDVLFFEFRCYICEVSLVRVPKLPE